MSDLKDQIIDFIQGHPGASTSDIRRAVKAKHARISGALSALESSGEVKNRGNENRHLWHVTDTSDSGSAFFVPPAEVPADAPEEIEGIRVGHWLTPGKAAELFDVAPRTLSRWQNRGFPSWGVGPRKLIPAPHAVIWRVEYEIEKDRERGSVSRLELGVAIARHDLRRRENGEPSIYQLPAS